MNTSNEKPQNSHASERTLYQVQVRRCKDIPVLLNEEFISLDWQRLPLPPRGYRLTEHFDTAAELDDGLFPFAMAMKEAWEVLSVQHAHAFEVRLVPYVVKTSYACFPQEPFGELERHPA